MINNAGIAGPVAPLVDIDVEQWDEVFDVNVRGVFLVCRAFLPAMVGRGRGDVINIASVSGKRPLIRRTPYCASKMAVIGLDLDPGVRGRPGRRQRQHASPPARSTARGWTGTSGSRPSEPAPRTSRLRRPSSPERPSAGW